MGKWEENDQARSGLLPAGAPGASCAWAPLPGSLLLRWRSMSLMNTQRRDPRADDVRDEDVEEDEDELDEAVTGGAAFPSRRGRGREPAPGRRAH
jgi:hypothetical protein